jgi:hypothetical protein
MRWFGPAGSGVGNGKDGVAGSGVGNGKSDKREMLSGIAGWLRTVALSLCTMVTKQITTPLSPWTEDGDPQYV